MYWLAGGWPRPGALACGRGATGSRESIVPASARTGWLVQSYTHIGTCLPGARAQHPRSLRPAGKSICRFTYLPVILNYCSVGFVMTCIIYKCTTGIMHRNCFSSWKARDVLCCSCKGKARNKIMFNGKYPMHFCSVIKMRRELSECVIPTKLPTYLGTYPLFEM